MEVGDRDRQWPFWGAEIVIHRFADYIHIIDGRRFLAQQLGIRQETARADHRIVCTRHGVVGFLTERTNGPKRLICAYAMGTIFQIPGRGPLSHPLSDLSAHRPAACRRRAV